MLIAEHLMLLCVDPARGTLDVTAGRAGIDTLAAAALVLDLADKGHLRHAAGYVAVDADLPISHPQLTAAERVLTGFASGMPLHAAIDLLVARLTPIRRTLLDSLFRRDVLHRERAAWWRPGAKRYPVRSLQALNEATAELRRGAIATRATLRGTGLLILTEAAGRCAKVLDAAHHAEAVARLDALAQPPPADTGEPAGLLAALRRDLLD
ncbi:GPP34 family phosphoprotein [Dokdonella sp. MW10]|uniref:GPP34 family phosphoprotein n=1 Tax=Dokdonella sp. MW10 TaxID=2992926 RepID=UPI003F7E0214